ncbi:radical SAM/SPASM domain-containing protein [Pseudochryseolinea flava]|uniref:Radical SAM/SPASM domain-containing protein n=1 Tax=Pseudochryseolinea flava TaxID=2059302 RepID=A0A364Y8P6_9BACT|nr:radical SAM/SPASM domain-containing protein [Pseudochryseolinea flava]RAW03486.1 radical SAM/SPASM domain-containing protein [Pseudochryseolinea flava]
MFKRVYLEISNICNVQCSFCPVVEKDKKIMDLAEFETVLKDVAPLTEIVCLHLLGEPLAHPKFSEILDICERYNTQIDLTTNGILIKRYRERIIQSAAVRQVNFSIQAFKDNFPERDLDPYLLPIFEFTKSAHASRPELYINYRLWNQQSNDADNEDVFQKIESNFDLQINRNVETGAIKSKRIWNKLYLHFDSRFEWPSFSLPHQGTHGRCHGTVNHIGIHADGTVVPCCLDKNGAINLGNAKQQSLQDILNSERFVKMRDGFLNGVLVEEFCQHCSFITRFNKTAAAKN